MKEAEKILIEKPQQYQCGKERNDNEKHQKINNEII